MPLTQKWAKKPRFRVGGANRVRSSQTIIKSLYLFLFFKQKKKIMKEDYEVKIGINSIKKI